MSKYCTKCGKALNDDSLFCDACGTRITESKTLITESDITINNNTKIVKNPKGTAESFFGYLSENKKRKSIEREKRRQEQIKEDKRNAKIGIVSIIIIFFIAIIINSVLGISSCVKKQEKQKHIKESIAQGKIAVQSSDDDLKGENYQTVKLQLESAGFTNIELIDLNDGGFLGLDEEKVKLVSIAGDSDFEKDDYFFPNDKIIITYY